MTNVLLGVTGSVAAIRTPVIYQQLRQAGFSVKVVATQASLYFFDPALVDGRNGQRNSEVVILDEDEWPGRSAGQRWQRGELVMHIELRRWADLLLIAPLDANTLAKLAYGMCDNCLTCVWRAWDTSRPVVLAPAMNTMMWEHPATAQHLLMLASYARITQQTSEKCQNETAEAIVEWINQANGTLRIVPPQSKQLACGDIGMGALAEPAEIVTIVKSICDASQQRC